MQRTSGGGGFPSSRAQREMVESPPPNGFKRYFAENS
jgi:hypothetical protein